MALGDTSEGLQCGRRWGRLLGDDPPSIGLLGQGPAYGLAPTSTPCCILRRALCHWAQPGSTLVKANWPCALQVVSELSIKERAEVDALLRRFVASGIIDQYGSHILPRIQWDRADIERGTVTEEEALLPLECVESSIVDGVQAAIQVSGTTCVVVVRCC